MKAEQNELLTRIGPGTPCGAVLRQYWQPVALLDEFDPLLEPRMAERPMKAVRLMGQDLVLFKNEKGHWGLIDRDCPHRGADLAFGRHEGDGIRCPFHGWKFDVTGQCIETPGEPAGSKLCERVKQRSYPVLEKSGVLFAWLGEERTRRHRFLTLTALPRPLAMCLPSKACGNATGYRLSKLALIQAIPLFSTAF